MIFYAAFRTQRLTCSKKTKLLRIMRLTAIMLLLATLSTSAAGYSQRITLNEKNVSIEKIFTTVEAQTDYVFFYDVSLLNRAKKVTITAKNISVEDLLTICFKDQPLTYSVLDKTIVIKSKKEVEKEPIAKEIVSIPLIDISGIVTDENGMPLTGASVVVKGLNKGTSTDKNGYFSLSQLNENDVLLVSYVGYENSTVLINGSRSITIQLKQSLSILNETVIVGYGTTTKRKSTGSIGSITSKEIAKQPIGNPLATLPGRISGTLVAQNNGLPGSAVQIQIRGQGTLSSGGIPLYVIDGVPFTNFNGGSPATDNLNAFGTSGANGGLSPFNLINPADIDRIDILKDADATAIYGSRAANGVVLITTKRGVAGKIKLDVNVSTGVNEVSHFIPMLNLKEYLQMRREAFVNDAITPTTANAPDLLVWDTTKSTDWQKFLYGGTGRITDVQATLSGGGGGTRFLFNTSYRKESTVFPGSNAANRFSTRLNIDQTSNDKKFNLSVNANYTRDNTDILTSDLASSYNLPPNLPLYDTTGKLFWSTQFTNPLGSLLKRYDGVTSNLIGSALVRYSPVKGLNIKGNFGYTITNLDQHTTNPASSQNPANNPTSSAVFAYNKASNYIIEPTIDYSTDISKGKLTVLAGASWQKNTSNSTNLNGANYTNEALLGALSAAGTVTASFVNIVAYKYAAAFGRVTYNWKEKYILNSTFRRDGSSRFGSNNRFGNFGSVSGTWIFTEESFLQSKINFLSFGKLRASYGVTGNDQISNYIYLPLYTSTTAYLTLPTIYPQTLPNADIQWETTKKLEFAMDLGFLKDRILFTANYYRNRSSNLITFTRVPLQSGYNSQTANLPALVQNSGLELELNSTNIKLKNFEWKTGFNITLPNNKLIDFPGLANTFSATSYIIGQPINFTRVYNFLGVNPANGQAQYEDIDKDGQVTFANDRAVAPVGTLYYGGLSNSLRLKNWELDLFWQFNHRNGTTNIFSSPVGSLRNQNTSVLNRWRVVGDVTSIPGASTTTAQAAGTIGQSWSNYTSSSAVWGNASYWKLRSANVSYTLPILLVKKAGITSCRLFAQAQNLFIIAKNKYILDTETQVQGGPSGLGTGTIGQLVPPLRTFVFGINCSF